MTELMLSPIGLFLAAVLSVTNVMTDVARKKVAERHELVASTFWIRVFAALVFTVALLVRTFAGSPPVIHAPAAFTTTGIKDLPGLAARLRQPTDAVSRFVSGRLSARTRQVLAGEAGSGPWAPDGLVADLNGIIRDVSIFDEQRFAGVSLSSQTRDLLAKKPKSEALAYLNRLLLEDAYPQEIAQNRRPALFGIASLSVPPIAAYLVYLVIVVG